MEADHITPWHDGGKTSAANCQMLCLEDNRRKGGQLAPKALTLTSAEHCLRYVCAEQGEGSVRYAQVHYGALLRDR